ncbi:MAG: haloacid dehalogenase-like hydrolase [Actinomycetes bacterium]|nr:MAG: haloacid dehalogenase [Actinomycetota bacterium]
MRTLVLWDIDHTLIDIAGLSREIYGAVFRDLVGRPAERFPDMAGRTDRSIITALLELNGVPVTGDLVETFADALAKAYEDRRDELTARGRELPGGRAALAALAGRPDVAQSVLTGNMKPIAICKLTAFGLHGYVDFDIGAYGLDGLERPSLVAFARERAKAKFGRTFGPQDTVLVGDTPRDVQAGHEGGARVVAVATGRSDAATLRAAGAEIVLPDLADTAAVIRAILPAGTG